MSQWAFTGDFTRDDTTIHVGVRCKHCGQPETLTFWIDRRLGRADPIEPSRKMNHRKGRCLT